MNIIMPIRESINKNMKDAIVLYKQIIAEAQGKELKYQLIDFHSSRPGHDLRYALDGSKMKEMGWEPTKSVRERIAEVTNWTLENNRWITI